MDPTTGAWVYTKCGHWWTIGSEGRAHGYVTPDPILPPQSTEWEGMGWELSELNDYLKIRTFNRLVAGGTSDNDTD